VGYKSSKVTDRVVYVTNWKDKSCLIICNFPNNPFDIYAEEPPELVGENDFSIYVYNDDGNADGFAELECNMQSVEETSGYSKSLDRVSTWIFCGENNQLNKILKNTARD